MSLDSFGRVGADGTRFPIYIHDRFRVAEDAAMEGYC